MNEISLPEQYDLETAALKVPPHSIEAEQAVLGGLMLDNDAWERVADQVSDGDFYRHDHRLIFRAVHVLAERNMPFDVVTVSEQLDKEGHLNQVGGLAYLGELAKNTPSVANIKAYAGIIRERATLRKLISVSSEIADSAYSPQGRNGDEILDEAERKIFEIAEERPKTGGPVGLNDILAKAIDRIDTLFNSTDAITGLTTGFSDLDDKTSGLQAAGLVVQVGEAGGQTGDGVGAVEQRVDAVDGLGEDVVETHRTAGLGALFGDLEDLALGLVENLVAVAALGRIGAVGDLAADADQFAQRGPLANDSGVGLDVGHRRSVLGQLAQVGQAADLVQVAFLVQLFGHGNHVERHVALGQHVDGAEDQPVVMAVEVAVRDLVGDPFPGVVVQHQATQHGLLGLDGMRRHLEGGGFQVVLLG